MVEAIRRLSTGGWGSMQATTREPDKRTPKQIQQSINAYIKENPELKEFDKGIKSMNPQHKGLVADILELSHTYEMLPVVIDLNNVDKRNVTKALIKDVIEASEKNPEALELVESVINNTDTRTAKYALVEISEGILKHKELASQMHETAKVMPQIAKETLKTINPMSFEAQKSMMDLIKTLVNPNVQPEKITYLFNDLIKFADSRKEIFTIDIDKFLTSKTPLNIIQANLKRAPLIIEMLGDKFSRFNIVEYLTKNVNLIKF